MNLLRSLVKTAHIKPAVNQVSSSRRCLCLCPRSPTAVQILLHPYNYADNRELLAFCAEHGIVVEAYSSLT